MWGRTQLGSSVLSMRFHPIQLLPSKRSPRAWLRDLSPAAVAIQEIRKEESAPECSMAASRKLEYQYRFEKLHCRRDSTSRFRISLEPMPTHTTTPCRRN